MELKAGFKKTDIGDIPQDWNIEPAVNIVESNAPICYGVVQVGRNVDNGVPIVAIKFVKEISHASLHRTAPKLEKPYARSRVRAGDVLISIKGTIGRIGVVPEGFVGNISRELARIRLNQNFLPDFIAHQLESKSVQERIAKAVVGTTRLEFSISSLRQFELAIPSTKAEQHAISKVLSETDALIATLDKLITKKCAIKTVAMRQLFTGKKRLSEFVEEWVPHKVKDVIATYFSGPSPTCEERNIEGSLEWGVLKTTASTIENGWDYRKHKLLPKTFWGRTNIELKNGDVIVTKAGPRHRVGIAVWIDYIPRKILPSGKMVALRCDTSKVEPYMLASAISSKEAQQYLDQRTTGMAESQVNFENSDLLDTPILLPSLDEQKAIGSILFDMEAEINILKERCDKIKAIKQGLMQELLTGRTRLV
jgi:type I restriction enzyme S subunit